MLTTCIEQTRLLHEEYEQHGHKLVEDLLTTCKTSKKRILTEHRVKQRILKMQEAGKKILEAYEDPQSIRSKELADISGENQFTEFYDRLKNIRDYHRNFTGEVPKITNEPPEVRPLVKFSAGELSGRFLDLSSLHERFVNMPMFPKRKETDYAQFLGRVAKFDDVPMKTKVNLANFKAYKAYVSDVAAYLRGFFERTNPLVDVEHLDTMISDEFQKLWKENKVAGWADFNKTEEKGEFFCSVCDKKFSKQTVFDVHNGSKKHKKKVKAKAAGIATGGDKKNGFDKKATALAIAHAEFNVVQWAAMLADKISDTQEYLEKKQTRTFEELAADLEEEEEEEEIVLDDSDSEDEKPLYNPLNLPLSWDGKPIPYWLYKLHGLNIEYKCEICGGYSYWGPRAFERHFTEWRHAYGMRCLGIDNSKHFKHITSFADARALHEKLQNTKQISFKEDDEEFEDDEGNVFDKKTYEDLKRQQII